MPSTRNLRRRIKSIKSTAQITRAMQMVASSKMRKAQLAAQAGRPYVRLMNRLLAEVLTHAGDFTHPLLEQRDIRRRCLIVISTDKGLCGALNSNLAREAFKFERATTVYLTAGRKAAQFISRAKRQLAAEFTYKDAPLFSEARSLCRFTRDLFLRRDVDRVEVLYMRFISTLTQKVELRPLLPLSEIRPLEGDDAAGDRPATRPSTVGTEFLFEPDAATVLGELLPHYLNFQLYQCMLEAKASEHSARMVAMKNATDNAHQLIDDLTLEYNKIRQASITKELLEIATAQMALA